MRSSIQSIDLIRRQLEKVESHLRLYSSRTDLVAGISLAINELLLVRDEILANQLLMECQDDKILKMTEVWKGQLLRLLLFICNQGFSSKDFLIAIDSPIDLLLIPHVAALKDEIKSTVFKLDQHSVQEIDAFIEETRAQNSEAENIVQCNLMTTMHQLDLIITKSI